MPRFPIVFACLWLFTVTAAAQVAETVTVERILIDVRVTDAAGEPILDLEPSDFTVKIGGKRATIESVTWIPDTAAARAIAELVDEGTITAEGTPATTATDVAPAGRLFVFFVQTDFARNSSRVGGAMKFMPHLVDLVEQLVEPDDRVAVLSFDSHLKFRLDFTSDRSSIVDAVKQSLLIDDPPTPPLVANPSLARRLERERMKKATSSEEALVIIGDALKPIPGPKTLVLLGWGLGELLNGRVVMPREYEIARNVLESARVTIFSLDTSDADYHSLEAGLQTAAADTGGFYAKTHRFPQQAVSRLQRTLTGHYELEVRRPAGLKHGTHAITVDVKRRGMRVLARSSFVDE
ncbi:MAG TPA: VWA domain-containing protein [Thermoanaerobaculia bacterium]